MRLSYNVAIIECSRLQLCGGKLKLDCVACEREAVVAACCEDMPLNAVACEVYERFHIGWWDVWLTTLLSIYGCLYICVQT